jgi:hypothetical protein
MYLVDTNVMSAAAPSKDVSAADEKIKFGAVVLRGAVSECARGAGS